MTAIPPDREPAAARSAVRRRVELVIGVAADPRHPGRRAAARPGGTLVFAGGLILILRNSLWARQRWARLKLRYPRGGGFVDRMMRRGSTLRRRDRDRQVADAQVGKN